MNNGGSLTSLPALSFLLEVQNRSGPGRWRVQDSLRGSRPPVLGCGAKVPPHGAVLQDWAAELSGILCVSMCVLFVSAAMLHFRRSMSLDRCFGDGCC